MTRFDWLATPTQLLAETVGGAVFHDGVGDVLDTRGRLEWYPPDIWRYVLACQWQRVAQEEAFAGRCAEVGDETGSRVVTARLGRDLMRLSLLMQRRYPPYVKWLGSAFARSPGAGALGPAVDGALGAVTWPQREAHLATALREAARQCNELGLTPPVDPSTRPFHDRPFEVLDAERFAVALRDSIADPPLATLPLVGAIDQFVDSTEVVTDPGRARALMRAALPELS